MLVREKGVRTHSQLQSSLLAISGLRRGPASAGKFYDATRSKQFNKLPES